MTLTNSKGYKQVIKWLKLNKKKPFKFQTDAWQYYAEGYSGLVNAPTGFGKTFSLFLAVVVDELNKRAEREAIILKDKTAKKSDKKFKHETGLKLIWITPLRSLAKDLARAMREVCDELELDWMVGVRNGDTSQSEKLKQKKQMPEVLIITPESMHLLLAQKSTFNYFEHLQCIVADEWHELLGSKRGVMAELAISRIKGLLQEKQPERLLRIWGISATIGNIDQALDVLVPYDDLPKAIIKADIEKKIVIKSILPDHIDMLPWAGHLGHKLAEKLLPIIYKSKTTLIFTNTRGQAELWYQTLLAKDENLAGQLAIHHGSIDYELRNWIEDSIHSGVLKAVVSTSSLDLGVDFKPVDTVVQIGSPKGVARFLQRAGRSGHSPYETSTIYFLPTHALELVEAAAIKEAARTQNIESREPMVMSFDVLIQYLVTLAVGDGFDDEKIFFEVKQTHAFRELLPQEWNWIMQFITTGGDSLTAYTEFSKVKKIEGLWKVESRQMAMRHRLHIGAIVSDAMIKVKYLTGGFVGMVEESFVSKMKPGNSFTLAGRVLEFIMIKEMMVMVRKSKQKTAMSPSWMGGRISLSSNLGSILRKKYNETLDKTHDDEELDFVLPLFERQAKVSHVPKDDEFLIELINTKDGYHFFAYPFEGRQVNEIMASLIAYRLGRVKPISFSIAMNDYGFELLSEQPIPLDEANIKQLFSPVNLSDDIIASINATEMARRKFRDIACISGLVFQGYPGKYVANKHLQSSAGLFFNVFTDYDKHNLLLRQAYDEAFYQQIEEPRLAAALHRIQASKVVIINTDRYTPLCFPIKVDSLRDNMSSEELGKRIERMTAEAEKKSSARKTKRFKQEDEET
ncbi:ligase-associated DNA damage response DEXH box helicase [Pedobacter psychroterrae]|uniref:Ligase-associated DNA damage response DEXH box helicase n=1 Tax=Pedobacter psychroterrae TaxID=2530453 RepID=A0A4R0NPI6_9SPHI|nr:ligase-associated DNA damage response DEXH box helicase [Pedobacter psychroterrae]TCD01633.1 ligase-associated DNA damage response DEXH box helicase [Pedobacter psychroterrae]